MERLTRERLMEIFDNRNFQTWTGDNALQGFLIMAKYLDPTKVNLIRGAEHDEVYGPSGDDLISAGLTEEDAWNLARLNWCYDEECFSCFV